MTTVTYTTIVAGVGDLTDNAHVIDRACEMARLNDAVLLLVAGGKLFFQILKRESIHWCKIRHRTDMKYQI